MRFELKRLSAGLFLGDANCLCAVIGLPAGHDEVADPELNMYG